MALDSSVTQTLRQWRKQVLECLPESWRERISSRITPYILELGSETARLIRDDQPLDELRSVDGATAARLKSHEYPLVLMLPPSWVLSKTVVLPAAAGENLRQVLGFELDRLTPFNVDQVYFDYQLLPRESKDDMLTVAVALVPRRRVDGWLDKLRTAGIPVDAMSAGDLWEEANLLPPEMRARPDLKRLAVNALPAVLVLVLLVAALALPLWQKRQLAVTLQQKENILRGKAAQVMKIREALDKEFQAVKDVSTRWQAAPPVIDLLQVLTNLLPDDTSLQRMEIKGTELIINGTSGQASSLIGLLQKAPGFDDPHFLSPVTQQRGKELFNLSATINMPFPREPGVERQVANPEDRPSNGNAEPVKSSPRQKNAPQLQAGKPTAGNPPPAQHSGRVKPASKPQAAAPQSQPGMPAVVAYPNDSTTRPLTHIRGSNNSAPVPDGITYGSGG
ncbi:type II secretion system protein GspL [Thiolapillus brandeum]|uniref:type II secretion system protein GspL n=1 Tax=Thiolapillus brandeum TaxID=1076588 RepID=UPI00069773C2|nr:type II secretion system protein GspL [Thiolapillus brandeum]